MKYYSISILLFFFTWNTYASNDSLKVIKAKKKIEKKIVLLNYAFEQGEYDEVIKLSDSYAQKKYFISASTSADQTTLKTFKANAQYVKLHFEKANNTIQEASAVTSSNTLDIIKTKLLLSNYYISTGNYIKANSIYNIADSLSKVINNSVLIYDLALTLAAIHAKTGLYKEALDLLASQKEFRKNNAEKIIDKKTDTSASNQKERLKKDKKEYAYLLTLTAECMLYYSPYDQSYASIEDAKFWVKKNIGEKSIEYMRLLVIEAKLQELNNNLFSTYQYYKKAYTNQSGSDYEENKLNNLSSFICAQLSIGDDIGAANYLRRLQMFAFRQLGKEERVQLAYDYTQAYQQFVKGELRDASQRLQLLEKRFSTLPENHPYALKIKELKINIAQKEGNVAAMQQLRLEHAAIIEKYYGTASPSYHKERLVIAIDEIYYGKNFSLSETIFKESYDNVLALELDKFSKENIIYLQAYAELFVKTDRFQNAANKQSTAAQITQKIYTRNSPEYLKAISKYTEYLIMTGEYKAGLDSIRAVNLLASQVKNGEVDIRQGALLSAASLNKLIGEYDKSQAFLKEANKLKTKSNYDQNILLESETAEQLSDLNIQTGNYYKVEKILQKSLENIQLKLGNSSPKLIPIYFNYARLNLITGNYARLDNYLGQARKLIDSVYGGNSLIMADCQLLYGDYYIAISDYKKSEEAYSKAEKIQRQKLGKKHLKIAQTILRQATLYNYQSNVKSTEIEKLYKEALEIVKAALGTTNPLYAEIQQLYAEFLISTKAYDNADKLLEEADKFWIAKLGKENNYTADINVLRGNIAYAKSKYDDAEKNYSKARDLYLSMFGDKHHDYVNAIGKIARVQYMKNKPEKALDLMNQIIPQYLTYTREIFPSLSFRQKTKFWNNLKDEFEFYTTVALQQPKDNSLKYTGSVYNNILSTKALLLSSSIKLLDKILHSNDSILIGLYNEWIAEKEYQISILSLSKQQMQEQGIQLADIQSNVERLEKEMSQRSEVFHKEKLANAIVWEDVRSKLQDNEYAIEIIRFRQFNKVFTDSVIYAALILNKNTKDNPDLVLLPNGRQMEKRNLKYYRNTVTLNSPDAYSYDTYWKPIKNKIQDGALIYLSCDGVYNQINLEMLPVKGTETYVLDQNQIVLLTNTKDLLSLEEISNTAKKKTKENKKLANTNPYVFCGSPEFYTNNDVAKKTIPDLPGAEKEIIDLNTLMASANKSTMLLTQKSVTEDTIKNMRSPKVLHIATHGYFKESVKGSNNDDDIASNPLLNSGLMLLGSGDIVDNPNNSYVNQKEGILTAYEAMDLPLENTDIVVLSACETGRGEIAVGEGVYGLQRAFLIAGAKSIVISLFKVNDDVTQKLMLSFYQKWLKSGDKRQAFTDAKKEIKQQYKEPLYWGAFLMIEGKPERFVSVP